VALPAAYVISTSQRPDTSVTGATGERTGLGVRVAESTSRSRSATTFSSPGDIIAEVTEIPAPADGDHVLPEGRELVIDLKAGISSGADSVDLTDTVDSSFKRVAEAAARAIPGLEPTGIDILARDFSRPATGENHIVCEINSAPGIGAHHFPMEGQPRNVARLIVAQELRRAGVTDR
jgi:hypothetical protein